VRLVSTTLRSLLAKPAGEEWLIDGIAQRGRVTLVFQPDTLITEWVAHAISVRATSQRPIGPIKDVAQSTVALLTASPRRESQRLVQGLTALANEMQKTGIEKRFELLSATGQSHLGPFKPIDVAELRGVLQGKPELLIVSDIRVFLDGSAHGCEETSHIAPTLVQLGKLAEMGMAVVVFVPQRNGPKVLDLRQYITPAAIIRLAADPGGPQNTGASVLVHRDRSGPLDAVPSTFRLYVIEKENDGALELGYDYAVSKPEQDKLLDRNIAILKSELAGVPRKDLSVEHSLSESRLSRIVDEMRAKLGPAQVALLAQDAQENFNPHVDGFDHEADS
jgi:hypothetical protein